MLFTLFTYSIMKGVDIMLSFIISILGVLLTMLGIVIIAVLIGAGYVLIKMIAYAIPVVIMLLAIKYLLKL